MCCTFVVEERLCWLFDVHYAFHWHYVRAEIEIRHRTCLQTWCIIAVNCGDELKNMWIDPFTMHRQEKFTRPTRYLMVANSFSSCTPHAHHMISWQHISSCTRPFCSIPAARVICVSLYDNATVISGYDKKRLQCCVRNYAMSTETLSCLRWTIVTLDYHILLFQSLCRTENDNNNSKSNNKSISNIYSVHDLQIRIKTLYVNGNLLNKYINIYITNTASNFLC